MNKHDKLKKSLNELKKQLEENDENSEEFADLKIKVQDALDSFGSDEGDIKEEITAVKSENDVPRESEELAYEVKIANAVESNLESAVPKMFTFVKTLDNIDKKSLKEAVSFTRGCAEGPDCKADDIIAVANTFPSKYFLEGMVFAEYGVFWEPDNQIYYIEYNDIEAVIVPKSESTVQFGEDIMLIERYTSDQITIPFNRLLYGEYRAIGDTLTALKEIAENRRE